MDELFITTKQLPNKVISLSLRGYLTDNNHKDLERVIFWLYRQGIYNFMLDLSQVAGIGWKGVSVLFAVFGVTKRNGGNLVIFRPSLAVKRVLKLFGLTRMIPVAQDMITASTVLNPNHLRQAVAG